jgi:hypothetical protein
MITVARATLRSLLLILLVAPLALAQQGKDAKELKPPTDDPPVGKAPILLMEDFETTEAGQVPKNYTKQGAVGVVDDVAHSGKHSLRMEAAVNGPRRITTKSEALAQLGGTHWGRLYFKVQLPAPECASGVIHSTIVSAVGKSPLHDDEIEFRPLDTILGTKGTYSYIYNVQPHTKRPEFAHGSASKWKFTDEWTLAEWYVDYATQTYRLWINSAEVKDVAFMKGPKNYEGSEIPAAMESITFGWWNYQQAGPKGFTAWIDDIALSKERLGARGVVMPKKKS